MATFTVAEGTDWIDVVFIGEIGERWRLDDYDIAAHVKAPGSDMVLLEMTLANGRLVIGDATARRLEINVGWALIEPLSGGFVFDFLFENLSTGVRSRSALHSLSITTGITQEL